MRGRNKLSSFNNPVTLRQCIWFHKTWKSDSFVLQSQSKVGVVYMRIPRCSSCNLRDRKWWGNLITRRTPQTMAITHRTDHVYCSSSSRCWSADRFKILKDGALGANWQSNHAVELDFSRMGLQLSHPWGNEKRKGDLSTRGLDYFRNVILFTRMYPVIYFPWIGITYFIPYTTHTCVQCMHTS